MADINIATKTRLINETITLRQFVFKGLNGSEICDAKGRAIGAKVTIGEVDAVAAPEGEWGFALDAGHYFTVEARCTRNFKRFGASQPTRYFKTAEERDAKIASYLKGAAKGATVVEI